MAVAKLLTRKKANEKIYLQKLKIFAIIFIESERKKNLAIKRIPKPRMRDKGVTRASVSPYRSRSKLSLIYSSPC